MHHDGLRGFTLVEILVTLGIIAVLGTVSVTILNPLELLRQARDSSRSGDMSTLASTIDAYSSEIGVPGLPSTVYVSIPDPAATSSAGTQCQGLGLPLLPTPWAYHCAASSTYKNVDGTGWIPANFSSLPTGSPVGSLPTDPINTSSSCLYYTYATKGGGYEVTSIMESQRYIPVMAKGGAYDGLFEKGSQLNITPPFRSYGLVGWWLLGQDAGAPVTDPNCSHSDGTWLGNPTNGSSYYGVGKDWPSAGYFLQNVSNNYVSVPANPGLTVTDQVTGMAWVYLPGLSVGYVLDGMDNTQRNGYLLTYSNTAASVSIANGTTIAGIGTASGVLPLNQWFHLAFTYTANPSKLTLFVNGVPVSSSTLAITMTTAKSGVTIGRYAGSSLYSQGFMNDIRVYNRALTGQEISAIYTSEK